MHMRSIHVGGPIQFAPTPTTPQSMYMLKLLRVAGRRARTGRHAECECCAMARTSRRGGLRGPQQGCRRATTSLELRLAGHMSLGGSIGVNAGVPVVGVRIRSGHFSKKMGKHLRNTCETRASPRGRGYTRIVFLTETRGLLWKPEASKQVTIIIRYQALPC